MFFVSFVKTWKPANKKCGELIEFVSLFEHRLIKDKCSLDALRCEIKTRAAELDEKYPRTAVFHIETYNRGKSICCRTDNSLDTNVFIFAVEEVKGTYEFSETAPIAISESQQLPEL